MIDSATMPPRSAPAAVIDALNGLLESELNSVFRFMGEGSPYLSRATVEVKRPLEEMVRTNQRHAGELSDLIESLGGYPVPRSIRPDEQYLAFLSLKFLLPKLVDEKMLILQRYDNALRRIPDAPPEVLALLHRHQEECRAQLETLKKAAEDVIAASRAESARAAPRKRGG